MVLISQILLGLAFTEYADTVKQDIKCKAPQRSIPEPSLSLLHVNDLPNSSKMLAPIMLADYINLFFEHSNINTLRKTVNDKFV